MNLFRTLDQRRELGGEIGNRRGDHRLHAALAPIGHQVVNELDARACQLFIRDMNRKVTRPELGGVAEQWPANHIVGNGEPVAKEHGGGAALDSSYFVVEEWLMRPSGNEQPVELQ